MDISNVLKEYKFRTEFHAHTNPVSRCGKISPEEAVERYSEVGADCIVITNHINPHWLERDPATRAEEYLSDYYRALEAGKKYSKTFSDSQKFVSTNCKQITNKNIINDCTYLYNAGGFVPYTNTSAQYFSSGTAFFEDVVERLRNAKKFICRSCRDKSSRQNHI